MCGRVVSFSPPGPRDGTLSRGLCGRFGELSLSSSHHPGETLVVVFYSLTPSKVGRKVFRLVFHRPSFTSAAADLRDSQRLLGARNGFLFLKIVFDLSR